MKKDNRPFHNLVDIIRNGNNRVFASALCMGVGQLMYKQWVKGILFLLMQIGFVAFFALYGGKALAGFFTLGTVQSNPWYGIEGDNSVTMLIMGIFAFIVLFLYFAIYWINLRDVRKTQLRVEGGAEPLTLREEARTLLDSNFHMTALALPIVGVSAMVYEHAVYRCHEQPDRHILDHYDGLLYEPIQIQEP